MVTPAEITIELLWLGYANQGKRGMYVEPETYHQGTQTDPSETENDGILAISRTNMDETMKLWG